MSDETSGTTDAQHDDRRDERPDDRPPEAVLAGLRDATHPLATTDPTTDADDLAAVSDTLTGARVVGLGEATHGTREFFQLKHRILAHLVTEHGVRHFAMEVNLPETEALDDYVVHGEGDPREALEGIYVWTWQTESVLDMAEWLREFNADRPLDDRVRVHGVDAQYTRGAVERLRDHFDAAGVELPEEVESPLDAVDDGGEHPYSAEDVPERVAASDRVVSRLRDLLAANREALVAATSRRAHERARRYVTVVEQAAAYAAANDALAAADDRPAAAVERVMRVRDRNMADNAEWLLDRVDAEPVVLWAHDAHLVRTEQVDRDTGAAATSLGGHLADDLGEDYVAVGFSFARGGFQAMSEGEDGEYDVREQHLDGPLPGTVDAALADVGEGLAFVDLGAASDDGPVADWLAEPRPHFSTGATYDDEDPTEYLTDYAYGEAFDAVCFVEETTRARPLDEEE